MEDKRVHQDHTTPSIGRLSIPTNAYYNTKYYIFHRNAAATDLRKEARARTGNTATLNPRLNRECSYQVVTREAIFFVSLLLNLPTNSQE
jgi:hypothetical protein